MWYESLLHFMISDTFLPSETSKRQAHLERRRHRSVDDVTSPTGHLLTERLHVRR